MKKFVFGNESGGIYPLAVQVISYAHMLAGDAIDDDVAFSLKTILIELLTNSLKHVNNDVTYIEVSLKDNHLRVKKLDKGKPLKIKTDKGHLEWPVTDEYVDPDDSITIYGDGFCILKGTIKHTCKLSFFTEEPNILQIDNDLILGLNEHYGLMMITRASNSFEYQYDPETLINTYSTAIELKKCNR